ncbi:thiamine pyrophosphate-dependent enzyme [Micromonospora sp. BRA006-A]|nr:thiamine pyrophosphate-dependent enzyme [Micromonospora sp. BRA006-A]
MRLARRLDDEAFALQRQGELGLWLQCRGQEAAQVGSVAAVRADDYVFPSYREHAAALWRGIGPADLLRQWRGVAHSGWDRSRTRSTSTRWSWPPNCCTPPGTPSGCSATAATRSS